MQNKIIEKSIIILGVFAVLTAIIYLVIIGFESADEANARHRVTIENIVKKKYPTYQIVDIKLEYVDWSSTVSEADHFNKATKAEVVIKNSGEQRTIRLLKRFFTWYISSDNPDYGYNVPNGEYYIEENYASIGKAVDMEEYVQKGYRWIIPDENGNLYRKVGEDSSWYYSIHYYVHILKTYNGRVYEFDQKLLEWKESDRSYSELKYYYNYRKANKDEVVKILKKYASYDEE